MKYYYQGCVSWKWYYPHHYSPFSSDLVNIGTLKFNFELGAPLRPFEQLMGVLPGESAREALPEVCVELMTSEDSPIIDFYPQEFPIDMEGCRFAWQGVVQLPFIDERRLLEAVRTLDGKFTEDEMRRNSLGIDLLYVHGKHTLIRGQIKNETETLESGKHLKLDNDLAQNLFGEISQCPYDNPIVISCIEGFQDILESAVRCFYFYFPVIEVCCFFFYIDYVFF
jgi:5'-3' exoribonuclease 2